jgi:crossover junction endodeoxyribonuclease RuvC
MRKEKKPVREAPQAQAWPHRRILLGIDPGVALIGYAVVHMERTGRISLLACDVIRTPQTMPHAERLQLIYQQLKTLSVRYAPSEAAVERLFLGGANVTSALHVGEARGVILLALAQHHIPVYDYWPAAVKLVVTGRGNATKKQVGECVRRQFGLAEVPKPDDAADAAAVALCHWRSLQHAETAVDAPVPSKKQRIPRWQDAKRRWSRHTR